MHGNGGGRIINVSARAAEQGKARMGPYCASKAAVLTLTESLAAENRFDNINVNCILPGTIDTPKPRGHAGCEFRPLVPPTALADVILFLASGAARCCHRGGHTGVWAELKARPSHCAAPMTRPRYSVALQTYADGSPSSRRFRVRPGRAAGPRTGDGAAHRARCGRYFGAQIRRRQRSIVKAAVSWYFSAEGPGGDRRPRRCSRCWTDPWPSMR